MNGTHMITNLTNPGQNGTPFTNISAGKRLFLVPAKHLYVCLTIEASMIPVILLSNLGIIWTVIFSAPLRKPSYVLVTSLATADFAVGAVVLPYDILFNSVTGLKTSETGCVVHLCVWVWGLGLSITHLFAIALERLVATQFPFVHRTSYTTSKAVIAAVLVWVICSGLGSGAFCSLKNMEYGCNMRGMLANVFFGLLTVYQITLILSTLFIYLRVLWTIRRSWNMRTHVVSASVTAERRRSILSFVVFVVFLLFWLPVSLNGLISRIQGVSNFSLTKYLSLVVTANSFVNSIVYGVMNREMRTVWKKALQCGRAASGARGLQ